jgi:hypothetical protein
MVLPHVEWKRLGRAVVGTVDVSISFYGLAFFMQVIRTMLLICCIILDTSETSCSLRNGKLL